MGYNVFLDTNIVVDFYVASRQHHIAAQRIFEQAELNKLKAYVSESVVNTAAYLLRKDYPLQTLKDFFTEMLEIFPVINAGNNTFINAYRNSDIKDMEDAVLYEIAVENKIDFFISNDAADFKNINKLILPVISSTAFIKLLF
jgi:predicted nucleic acid-binding protein